MGSGVGGDLRASQKHVHHMTGSRGILAVFEVFPPLLGIKAAYFPRQAVMCHGFRSSHVERNEAGCRPFVKFNDTAVT